MLRITDWDENFETHRTRPMKKLNWVPVPNKQDGEGYRELIEHEDGAAHFGVWCAILQVASKCKPRGYLVRSNQTPIGVVSLSRKTGIDTDTILKAIDRLLGIGWLECSDDDFLKYEGITPCGDPAEYRRFSAGDRAKAPLEGKGREGKGTEENRKEAVLASSTKTVPPKTKSHSYPEAFERWYALYPRKAGKFKACEAWRKAIKIVDAETLERQTAEFAKSPMGNTSERKYIKHASVWLNGRHWEDDPSEWGVVYSDAPGEPENPGDWAKTPEEKLARFGLNPKQLAWVEEHGDDFDFPGVKGADHLLPSNRGRSPD